MKFWIQAVSAVLIISAPICLVAANEQGTATAVPASPTAVAQNVRPFRYQMQLVMVADTEPQEWIFVVGRVGFKSIDALKKFVGIMPSGSILEWNPGGVRIGSEPLLSSKKDLVEFKKFCESKHVTFILIPGK